MIKKIKNLFKTKRWPVIVVCCCFIFIMLCVALYPVITNIIANRTQSYIITAYDEQTEAMDKAERERMLEEARAYNASLADLFSGTGAFTEEGLKIAEEGYYDILDINGIGMMGYVEVPSINVYMPIYHGTDDETLEYAAGHLIGTSFPVGGEDTHAVISAHSGLSSRKMFSDLEELQPGDLFFIHVLGEVYAYEVEQLEVVLPEETDSLIVTEGEDKVTLVTCYPFAVNTHRLLVTGYRTDYDEEGISAVANDALNDSKLSSWTRDYLIGLAFGGGAFVVIGFGAFIIIRRNKRKK